MFNNKFTSSHTLHNADGTRTLERALAIDARYDDHHDFSLGIGTTHRIPEGKGSSSYKEGSLYKDADMTRQSGFIQTAPTLCPGLV
jgi:hypothetical protein